MTSKSRQIVFGFFSLVGLVATWYFNIQFMGQHEGFSLVAFVSASYANAASTSISNDLIIVVSTFLFWSFLESRRLKMPFWWLYFILTFAIAAAFTLPLFMLMRERAIAATNASHD